MANLEAQVRFIHLLIVCSCDITLLGQKEGARMEATRSRLREIEKKDPTMSQWANAVGMRKPTLEMALGRVRECKNRITRSYRRLVVSIATPYCGRGLTLHDLIQEGSIGLLRGAERFDHSKGNKLSTYVYWWIKQAIVKAVATKSRIVRLPVCLILILLMAMVGW